MRLLAFATIFGLASAASADTFVLGVGYDDVFGQTDTESVALVVEYHRSPFYQGEVASYSIAGAAQVDSDGDVFVGVGVSAKWVLNKSRWFVEGSLMPGYYDQGSGGTPLSGNIQFRTLVGIGYDISDKIAVSLALDHKSNASIERDNPGSETVVLRYRVKF